MGSGLRLHDVLSARADDTGFSAVGTTRPAPAAQRKATFLVVAQPADLHLGIDGRPARTSPPAYDPRQQGDREET